MNTLAICTFDDTLQIAVDYDGFLAARLLKTGLKHSENLMPCIIDLLKQEGLTLADIDLLCCTGGPGSFTGLRIGMSTLKGIAYALKKPLVSVSTMETIAYSMSFFDGAVVPLLDARKQKYYAAVFENGKRSAPDMDVNPEELKPFLNGTKRILFTGQDAQSFAEEMRPLLPDSEIFIDCAVRNYAQSLIALAKKQFADKGADDIGQGPVYLRKSEAEAALEARLKEAGNGDRG